MGASAVLRGTRWCSPGTIAAAWDSAEAGEYLLPPALRPRRQVRPRRPHRCRRRRPDAARGVGLLRLEIEPGREGIVAHPHALHGTRVEADVDLATHHVNDCRSSQGGIARWKVLERRGMPARDEQPDLRLARRVSHEGRRRVEVRNDRVPRQAVALRRAKAGRISGALGDRAADRVHLAQALSGHQDVGRIGDDRSGSPRRHASATCPTRSPGSTSRSRCADRSYRT